MEKIFYFWKWDKIETIFYFWLMVDLTPSQSQQLNKYGYFFTIVYKNINDGIVYYYMEYGKEDLIGVIQKCRTIIRFSDLRNCKILLKYFPSRTLFYHTDASFIKSRVEELKKWVVQVLEYNKSSELFDKLEGIRLKFPASSSRLCFSLLSEESD